MRIIKWLLATVVSLLATALFAGQLGFLRGTAPSDLGVHGGLLKPPSLTPNSVSSQADLYPDHPQKRYASIAPLVFQGDGDQAMTRLTTIIQNSARVEIVRQEPGYLYAQSTSALLRFTDDVEFSLDRTAHVIHMRSASRLGREDFGVNRERLEKIRAQFEKN